MINFRCYLFIMKFYWFYDNTLIFCVRSDTGKLNVKPDLIITNSLDYIIIQFLLVYRN